MSDDNQTKLQHRDDLSDRELVAWSLRHLSGQLGFPYNNMEAKAWEEKLYSPEEIRNKEANQRRLAALADAIDNGHISLDGEVPE